MRPVEQSLSGLDPKPTPAARAADAGTAGGGEFSLRTRAIRASLWTLLEIGSGRFLRLCSNLILTRLLFPEAFGLMAVVNVFVHGMQMMSDFGIGPSIIQNKRGDDRDFLDTAWTLQIVRGAAIWVGIFLASSPAAWFYSEPQFRSLLPAIGLTALVSGFNSTARYTVNRHLALGKLTLFDLIAQVVSITVMIVWACLRPTIWALAAGALAGSLARMLLSHHLLPGPRNRLRWDRLAFREVIGFGKWIFLSSALSFVAIQVDKLIFPKLMPFEVVGVYAIAFMLSSFPDSIVTSLSGKVIFPAVSQRAQLPRQILRDLILQNRWLFLCVAAVLLAILCAFADALVCFLYDERYHDASWMLAILALGLWPRMLTNTLAPALLAIGQPKYFAFAATTRVAWVCFGVPLAYLTLQFPGAVAAVALGPLAEYVVEGYGLWRHRLLAIRQDLLTTALWLGVLLGLLLLRDAVDFPMSFLPAA